VLLLRFFCLRHHARFLFPVLFSCRPQYGQWPWRRSKGSVTIRQRKEIVR
jgi:hypothetical protein